MMLQSIVTGNRLWSCPPAHATNTFDAFAADKLFPLHHALRVKRRSPLVCIPSFIPTPNSFTLVALCTCVVRRALTRRAAERNESPPKRVGFSGLSHFAVDPGREQMLHEFLGTGEVILSMSLEGGGLLEVQRHPASEQTSTAGGGISSHMEWRTMRFKPPTGSSNLFQSVTKVMVSGSGSEQSVKLLPECLGLKVAKSFVSVVLAALQLIRGSGSGLSGASLRFLCIGLGGGSVPAFLAAALPHSTVDVVELEAAVVEAAQEGMGFVPDERLRVVTDDGAAFALRAVERMSASGEDAYDAVLLDAYDASGRFPDALWSPGGSLVQALAKGLLKKEGGLLAADFLPFVDVSPPLSTYRAALAAFRQGSSFSVQVHKTRSEMNFLEQLLDDGNPGNSIAIYAFGGPAGFTSWSDKELCVQLHRAATEVQISVDSPFDMTQLATRGLRVFP